MRKAIRRIVARARGIFVAADDSIAREMEAHLDMATDEYIRRGMSPAEARRAARIDAGGIDAAGEAYRDQHGVPVVDALLRDLRFALRGLQRNPRFGIGIAVSLALGIGLNTAIFTVVDNVLRRPLPFTNPDQLVAVGSAARGSSDESVEWTAYPETIKAWQNARSVQAIAFYNPLSRVASGTLAPEYTPGALASSNFASTLGARLARGRWFTEEELHEPVAVISDGMWRHQFGADTGVIGKTLRLNGTAYAVIGVLAPGLELPVGSNFWIPMVDPFGQVIVRLRQGQALDAADAELTMLSPMRRIYARQKQVLDVVVEPLHDHLYGSARPALLLLFGAAILLLLITCANVTNLSLARALDRRRELAMRVALGASHAAVGSLLFLENLLLTVVGGLAGLATAWLVTDSLVALAPPSVTVNGNIQVRGVQVAFVAVLVVGTCVLVSLAPLLSSMPNRLASSLMQSSARAGRGRGLKRMRQSLVTAQLALTLVLVTGAGVIIHGVQRMTRPDHLGFSPDGVVIATVPAFGPRYRVPGAAADFYRRLREKVREIPGVRSIASGPPPLISGMGTVGYREGFNALVNWHDPAKPGAGEPGSSATGGSLVWVKHVDPAYRDMFGITVSTGRWITDADDSASTRVAIVNRAAARLFFGDANPIGRLVDIGSLEQDGQAPVVVGVIGDVLQRDLSLAASPEVILPLAQQRNSASIAMLAVKSTAPARVTVNEIRRVLNALDPELAASRLQPMRDAVDASIARQRFVLRLLTLFASLGLVLAAIGLYAVVSYLVAQRTPEIGVRIALGADRRHVVGLVMRESARLAAIGVTIGIPFTIAGTRLLSGLLYGLKTWDLPAFAIGPAILAAVAIGAAWLPSRRAAAVDPALTIRAD
jgi:predicted permease